MFAVPCFGYGRSSTARGRRWKETNRRPLLDGTPAGWAIYAIHITVMRANAINPPSLAISQLLLMVFIYLAALAWWVAVFLRHFKKQTG
jgi:hypothetical protein